MLRFLNSARRSAAARGPAGNAPGGKFCRRIYRGLTITAQALRYSGTDDAFGWGFSRCASTDRTERRSRPRRPPRAAAPAALSRVSEQEAPRNSAAAGSLARDFDRRCADRPAGRRGSGRAQEARGRQGPQCARRARRAQARPARRQRRRLHAGAPQGRGRGADRATPATPASTRCWAKSTCAWRSNWPKPASASRDAALIVAPARHYGVKSLNCHNNPAGVPASTRILSAAWRAYISLPRGG